MFVWVYLDGEGREVGRSSEVGDREAAEAWLARSWEELSDRGIESVELCNQDLTEPLYRMSLADPAEKADGNG